MSRIGIVILAQFWDAVLVNNPITLLENTGTLMGLQKVVNANIWGLPINIWIHGSSYVPSYLVTHQHTRSIQNGSAD